MTIDKNIYYITVDKNGNTVTGDLQIAFSGNINSETFNIYTNIPEITFSPSSITTQNGTVNIIVNAAALEVGSYVGESNLISWFNQIPFSINLEVIDSSSGYVPPQPGVPALKYWSEKITDGVLYRLNILEKGFGGTAIEIHGNVKHNYAERKDLIQALVPSSLDIELDADETLTLSDLYSEDEQHFIVELYRDSQKIFHGFLKPDGIWEDWVSDKWQLSLDAMDGLGILKNLRFVNDNGGAYEGVLSAFDIIYYALRRIGFELPINICADLPVFADFTGTNSILTSLMMNTERFYQSEGKSDIMDCESVLKSVLEVFNASIIQMNGEWWIFRANDVSVSMIFHRYVNQQQVADVVWDASVQIGSHIHNFPIHHIGGNQRKSIAASVQAFRLNYKYGVTSLGIDNAELKFQGTTNQMPGWWWLDDATTEKNDGGGVHSLSTTGEFSVLLYNTQTITVNKNDGFTLFVESENLGTTKGFVFEVETPNYFFHYGIWKLKSGTPASGTGRFNNVDNYYKKGGNVGGHGRLSTSIGLPPMPEDGNVTIRIRRWPVEGVKHHLIIFSVDLKPSAAANYKGEFHTAQRLTRVSSVVKADKTVYNGDSVTDIYYGTMYMADGTPTYSWNRKNKTDQKSILQINVEDNLRISPRPMVIFEGDVYGYFPYLSMIAINNVGGNFQVSKYSYDTSQNINRNVFREFETDYLQIDTDFRYEFDYDFGNETRVLISK